MFALYERGYSLAEVARAFATTRQSVYKMLVSRGLRLRGKRPLPFIEYRGERYTLRVVGYYGKTRGTRSFLHRDVWQDANGPIPEGMDIHHRDGNRENNALENLALMDKADHTRLHAKPRKR